MSGKPRYTEPTEMLGIRVPKSLKPEILKYIKELVEPFKIKRNGTK